MVVLKSSYRCLYILYFSLLICLVSKKLLLRLTENDCFGESSENTISDYIPSKGIRLLVPRIRPAKKNTGRWNMNSVHYDVLTLAKVF